jgi:hypothetical protein
MARHQIIEKLNAEMSLLPITRESQIVYILAEIRKALEQLAPSELAPFTNLKFFCNWALHSKIDQNSSQKRIKEFCSAFDLHDIHARRLISTEFLKTMIMLRPLQESLARFFGAFSIRPEITHNRFEWYRFVYHYSGIVSDVPLVRNGSVPDAEVKEVRVSCIKNTHSGWPDFIHWAIKLGNESPRWASIQLGQIHDEHGNLLRIDSFLVE